MIGPKRDTGGKHGNKTRREKDPKREKGSRPGDEALLAAFSAQWGKDARRIVRAPGRVNLIGEHVDYAGLPVLPMALRRSVVIAARARDDERVRIASADPAYEPREFHLATRIAPFEPGDWGNYAKAAAGEVARTWGVGRGMDALVVSDLPVASGLSSSAAMVIGVALALLDGAGATFERIELADRMADAERYVGTRGGGMDQAICLLAREGHASRIEFEPLRVTHAKMPDDWVFVVAHSLVQAHKSGGAKEAYNSRRAAVEAALPPVVARLGLDAGETGYPELVASTNPEALLEAGEAVLEGELRKRFRHVVTEALRTRDAEAALRSGDAERFGRLMDGSHASLRDDFEVSTPELDAIVEIARAAGADGARLTGAGMGGCAIALCRGEAARAVHAALAERFYAGRTLEGPLSDRLFEARPAAGASVRKL